MASYLLKAPDDDLARWKAIAAKRGITFAAFARDAIEQHATDEPKPAKPEPIEMRTYSGGTIQLRDEAKPYPKEKQARGR